MTNRFCVLYIYMSVLEQQKTQDNCQINKQVLDVLK